MVTSAHLELAQAVVGPGAFVPFKVQVDEMSSDGDSFGMALHAATLAQWANGVNAMPDVAPAPAFAGFSMASVELSSVQPCFIHWAVYLAVPFCHPRVMVLDEINRLSHMLCRFLQ